MDEARRLAREGAPGLSVVVAEIQTGGRGRLRRAWDSRPGGLYFSLILRPDLPPTDCFRLNFLASVTLARILKERFAVDVVIKWPNDILAGRRKLAGMLSEMETEGDRVDFVSIGIGVNVNNTPPRTLPDATSLRKLLGRQVPRHQVLEAFLDAFETGLDNLADTDILAEWRRRSLPMNREVTVVTTRSTYRGMAEGIDAEGALLLRLPDGSVKRVLYGDCFV